MRKLGTISFVVAMAVLVTGLVFLGSGPAAWATSNQSPAAQTVPTPAPTAVPTAAPQPTAIPVTPAPISTPVAGGSTGTVTSSGGGSVTTPDKSITVTAPAGAAAHTSIDVAVTPKTVADAPAPAPAATVLRNVFTVQASVSGVVQSSYSFNQAVSICTTVTQADFDAVRGNVGNLTIMRFADDTKSWNSLPTNVNPPVAGGQACATTRSLSTFALAAKGQVAATATPAPAATPTAGLPTGDSILSGGSGWWTGLAMVGMLLVLFGGFALRRTTNKRNI